MIQGSKGDPWGTVTPALKEATPSRPGCDDDPIYHATLSDIALKDAIRCYVADVEEEEEDREDLGPSGLPSDEGKAQPIVSLVMGEEEDDEQYHLDHMFPRGFIVGESTRKEEWLIESYQCLLWLESASLGSTSVSRCCKPILVLRGPRYSNCW